MFAGVPVLAANTGGPLETVVEGETGWLRNPDNPQEWTKSMRSVLWQMDQLEMTKMGAKGKARVEKEFSRDVMARRLDEEIEGMVGTERQPFVDFQDILLGVGMIGVFVAAFLAAVLKNVARNR